VDAGPTDERPNGWFEEQTAWLRPMIRRRLGNLDFADEVLQEVMLVASQSSSVPKDPHHRGPWLARVAIRQCAMTVRSWCRRNRREAIYAETRDQSQQSVGCDPIEFLLACEQRELVRQAMQQLDPLLKKILVMKYVSGHSYKEIGIRLNMEVSAVEYRLAVAKQTLRGHMTEAGYGVSDDE
jgi:RNA polymerase sigma factor (sigma-70 family)